MLYKEFEKEIKKKQGCLPNTLKRLYFRQDGRTKVAHDPMNRQVNDQWVVYPIALTKVHVYVVCPFCGRVHKHGVVGDNYSGNRVAHCKEINGQYYIAQIPEGQSTHNQQRA